MQKRTSRLLLNTSRSRGDIELLIQRASGRIDRFLIKNLYTDGGLGILAGLEAGEMVSTVSHMALGTGTTPADGEDTALQMEIPGSRVAVSISGSGASRLYTAVFADGVGEGPVTEAGLFTAASAGVLSNRSVFGVKTKEPGEVFTFNWLLSHYRA